MSVVEEFCGNLLVGHWQAAMKSIGLVVEVIKILSFGEAGESFELFKLRHKANVSITW